MRPDRRAASLLEVMVAAGVMGLLVTAVFAIFRMGIAAWFKTDGLAELTQQGQLVGARWVRDAEVTCAAAVTVSPSAICFPSALDDTGNYVLDNTTSELIWQSYRIYYLDSPSGEVRWLEVPIDPPTRTVVPIEAYDPGGGARPLASYLTGGRVLARSVTVFQSSLNGRMSWLTMEARKRRPNSQQIEVQQNIFSAMMRN